MLSVIKPLVFSHSWGEPECVYLNVWLRVSMFVSCSVCVSVCVCGGGGGVGVWI